MAQSRTQSALETALNIASGYLLAIATQAVLYPLYGIHTSVTQDAGIAAVFTVVSLVRSYAWRRIFNRLGQRSKPVMGPLQ